MYMLFEYITCFAVVFVVGALLFAMSALVVLAEEMLLRFYVGEWLGATTPSRRAQPAHGRGIEIAR